MNKTLPEIALGAWSWGAGAAGGDQVFGNHLSPEDLKPVFDKAMECGLNLWDTAAVYGEGTSERILGNFVEGVRREIHNPMDVERWTPKLIPLAKSGQIKAIGVSNHNFTFYAYMVLEQGALTGRYTEANPFPAGTGRGDDFNMP